MNYGFSPKAYHRIYRSAPKMLTSKNEWQFYATRACVGAGLPYGAAEIIAQAGLYASILGGDAAQTLAVAVQDFAHHKTDTAFHQMLALHDRLLIARYEQLNFDCNAPLLVACAMVAVLQANNNPRKNSLPITLNWQSDKQEYYVQYQDGLARLSFDILAFDSAKYPHQSQPVTCALINEKTREDWHEINLVTATQNLFQNGVAIDDEAWHILVNFYRKTLVPSSEASRAGGAGAGKIDND